MMWVQLAVWGVLGLGTFWALGVELRGWGKSLRRLVGCWLVARKRAVLAGARMAAGKTRVDVVDLEKDAADRAEIDANFEALAARLREKNAALVEDKTLARDWSLYEQALSARSPADEARYDAAMSQDGSQAMSQDKTARGDARPPVAEEVLSRMVAQGLLPGVRYVHQAVGSPRAVFCGRDRWRYLLVAGPWTIRSAFCWHLGPQGKRAALGLN